VTSRFRLVLSYVGCCVGSGWLVMEMGEGGRGACNIAILLSNQVIECSRIQRL